MTYEEMYNKIEKFVYPTNVAFVSIEFELHTDANIFKNILIGFGYYTVYYRNRNGHELRFTQPPIRAKFSKHWVTKP